MAYTCYYEEYCQENAREGSEFLHVLLLLYYFSNQRLDIRIWCRCTKLNFFILTKKGDPKMTSPRSRIAIIFDFDDTLAPDSTSSFLQSQGVDVRTFWKSHADLLKEGWDPIPAYLDMMLKESQSRPNGKRFTRETFQKFGKSLKPHHGLQGFCSRIEKLAKESDKKAEVLFFIVSSGIGDIIRHFRQRDSFNGIAASDFSYNRKGEIDGVKRVISFTDKTRYIFEIQKGIFQTLGEKDPFAVNKKLHESEHFVSMRNMIMVGDGLTDVPCFSLIEKGGGTAIGVYDRAATEKWGKAWGLISERRVNQMVAADFRKNSGLDDAVSLAVKSVLTFRRFE